MLILSFILFSPAAPADNTRQDKTYEAQQLIATSKNSILQIRVIENTTNKKSSIGSGFFVSASGLIATNYHVVSSVVQQPNNYHLEYLDYQGNRGQLDLVDIDVVHDLAIVTVVTPIDATSSIKPIRANKPLALSKVDAQQGEKLFSIGNPHDLGLTIVEGTNNGLLQKVRNEKIHFSGSLNPGMSGGPTINQNGEVVGVNVSTAGNQISFLVPAKFLTKLMKSANLIKNANKGTIQRDRNFEDVIEAQLYDEQLSFFSNLLAADWPKQFIGQLNLPAEINDQFKCWGNASNDEDKLVEKSTINCSTADRIYIAGKFNTGQVHYAYTSILNRELTTIHFYDIYQAGLTLIRPINSAVEEFVTNFSCYSDFVPIAGFSWRAHTCARRYKKYPLLYDVSVDMTMIGEEDHGMVINLVMSGVSQKMSQKMIDRFFREITWQQ